MNDHTPAGWHTDPLDARRLRYWDGNVWTEQTAAIQPTPSLSDSSVTIDEADTPADNAAAEPRAPGKRRRPALWIGLVCLLIAALAGLTVWGIKALPPLDPSAGPTSPATASAPPTAPGTLSPDATEEEVDAFIESLGPFPDAPEPDENAATDAVMEGQGWTPVLSGNVYLYVKTPDEFSCGYLDCLFIDVYTVKGCPGGVFVDGSIMSGDVSIGRVNDWTAALGPQGQAQVLFEDYTRRGDSFQVNGATCH